MLGLVPSTKKKEPPWMARGQLELDEESCLFAFPGYPHFPAPPPQVFPTAQ